MGHISYLNIKIVAVDISVNYNKDVKLHKVKCLVQDIMILRNKIYRLTENTLSAEFITVQPENLRVLLVEVILLIEKIHQGQEIINFQVNLVIIYPKKLPISFNL